MRRYLVIANQTLTSEQLQQELLLRVESSDEECLFHFVVPDTAKKDYSPGWTDTSPESLHGVQRARQRLQAAMEVVRAAGASALGALGNPDPMKAVELQMQCSAYDEIIVSMLPEKTSRWFNLDLPSRIARAVPIPVTTMTAKAS